MLRVEVLADAFNVNSAISYQNLLGLFLEPLAQLCVRNETRNPPSRKNALAVNQFQFTKKISKKTQCNTTTVKIP